MTNRRRNLTTSIIFLLFGAFMLVQALGVKHKIESDVGSGYVPAFIAICLIIVSVAKLILTVTGKSPADEVKEKKDSDWLGGVVTIAMMALYMFCFEPIGFVLSSAVYLFAQITWFSNSENRKPILFAIISIMLPIAIDALFVYAIKMPLPKGVFGF
ncbi:putative tricarboxylic transport membrane protein [Moryella indoligenes]|uniref:Tricarboxylic transport membrane protein n=1 Tax=Moryella indoligenes TaxID=371674 RepID=A0AAE4AJU6_9FIRM|nr:tripartite tricarboxylate transporter TctB family protein [Moryella indoligenes]MDQ0152198.1 putative tricarboxylic transport membrane protein [Moryella indoligenes]